MKLKKRWILWIGLLMVSWPVWAHAQSQSLRVYMPRSTTIKGAIPNLGQIAILRGDADLVNRLRSVSMGRIASPGGQVIIDRNAILSRLASFGVDASKVTLSGAEKITVQQQSTILTSATLVKRARAALQDFSMSELVSQVTLMRGPAIVIVPGSGEALSVKVDTIKQTAQNQIRVRIEVLREDERLAVRDIIFGLKFRIYRLVTNADVLPGTAIDHRLVRVVEGVSNRPVEPKAEVLWRKNPEGKMVVREGLMALRKLPAGAVIRPGMIGAPSKAVRVKRRQSVVIRFENLGLMVSAIGVAQEDGCVGDVIKVKNADSQRLIMARVNVDGSVAPVL
ncbi:MAG: flagella basal body P-ring formation protein FlgA [Planctomycetes bacterium]|nr:flagella basal body P-ring formation protein FlgA [Planctomycetota bacterium]